VAERVIAARKSIKCFPAGLNAAEFATCSSRAASRGSVPTIFTISVKPHVGFRQRLRMRINDIGKEGRLTVPFETFSRQTPRKCQRESVLARSRQYFRGSGCGPLRGGYGCDIAISIIVQKLRTGRPV